MKRRKLPTGIQTFRKIREDDCYYVDKTALIDRLVREDRVYNPFDILLLFDSREFAAHWFETGAPTFLIDTLIERGVASPELDGMLAGADLLSAFDVDEMEPEALLFQTGYLTIRGVERSARGPRYRLGYPNREVRLGLNERLLRALAPHAARRLTQDTALERALEENDFAALEKLFRAFFAGIPYEWHTRNGVARYEGYYASVCYSWFAALGLDVTVEDSSSSGRVDLAVRYRTRYRPRYRPRCRTRYRPSRETGRGSDA